jgi:hypothetical protein
VNDTATDEVVRGKPEVLRLMPGSTFSISTSSMR